MKSLPIPHSDLSTARLSYGCMRIAGTWNPQEIDAPKIAAARAAVIAAYDAGYTLFDHADIYCKNECERLFGDILHSVPAMRDRIVIATKCGIRFGGDPLPTSPHRYDFSRQHILWSCDNSLKMLRTDHIDIYQLHRPDLLMNPHEVAAAFDTLHKAGKVRYFGVSNFLPSFVTALQSALPYKLVCNQVEIHLGRLNCLYDGTLDQCLAEKILPLSWSPLGGGFLGAGGKLNPADPKREPREKLQTLLDTIAKRHGVSRTVISLAWLLKHPAGIVPIVGSCKPENIRDATQADTTELTREEWYELLVAARNEKLP